MSAGSIRLDKWLWFARCARTRGACQRLIEAGRVRVNGARTLDNDAALREGDVLTLALPGALRVLKVRALGARRGDAGAASLLFEDLSPALPREAPPVSAFAAAIAPRAGRPSKKGRRMIARLDARARKSFSSSSD